MIIKSILDYSNKNSIENFNCGNAALDTYLKQYASQNDKNNISKTYLYVNDNDDVVGFVTLCAASIDSKTLPKDLQKLPNYPIPAIRIARLAVDLNNQGNHVGKELLRFALRRIAVVSTSIGVKFAIVDAKEESKSFYEKYGFVSLLDRQLTYILPVETIIKAIIN